MFHNYTYEGCIFECKLKNAFKSIGCIPWDYPIPPSVEEQAEEIKICNSRSKKSEIISHSDLAKFYDYMNNEISTTNCSCWSDCEEESFEIQVLQ